MSFWNYSNISAPKPYGSTKTYRLAKRWLRNCPEIEDWGCGSGYFGTLLPKSIKYKGIDGAVSKWGSLSVVDLETYSSSVPGILLRHVLEHNFSWEAILDNALGSFTQRMCLVLFVPTIECDGAINKSPNRPVPNLALPSKIIMEKVGPFLRDKLEINTKSQYRHETVYFLEKGKI